MTAFGVMLLAIFIHMTFFLSRKALPEFLTLLPFNIYGAKSLQRQSSLRLATICYFLTKVNLLFVSMLLALNSLICCDFPIEDYLKVRDERNFTGKVVLVTGSSAGIGAGIAKLFSILGANVVVTGRNVSRIQSVGKEVQELSPKKLKVFIEIIIIFRCVGE